MAVGPPLSSRRACRVELSFGRKLLWPQPAREFTRAAHQARKSYSVAEVGQRKPVGGEARVDSGVCIGNIRPMPGIGARACAARDE